MRSVCVTNPKNILEIWQINEKYFTGPVRVTNMPKLSAVSKKIFDNISYALYQEYFMAKCSKILAKKRKYY